MKIKAQAPARISLFGGSSDLPIFYQTHGGLCISFAINLYKTIEINTDILEPDMNKFIAAFFDEFDLPHYLTNEHSDIPLNSGLGGSASLAVALVAALSRLKGENPTREEIAEKAWDICNNKLGLYSGKQDEYAASFGGMNTFTFDNNRVQVAAWDRETGEFWSKRFLLFRTNQTRVNPKIQEGLKVLTKEKIKALEEIRDIATNAIGYIADKSMKDVADLMHLSWKAKKKSNNVTNPRIDDLYQTGIINGALAGKLLGSGGGGHMIFLAEEKDQQGLIEGLELAGAKWIDYSIDWTGVTIRIL